MKKQEDLDRYLKEQLPDYIRRFTNRDFVLKANGKTKDPFLCLNPEHMDHEPSMGIFTGSDGIPRAHCFACGKTYDLYGLIEDLEGLTFPQAKERAAEIYGVEVPKTTKGPTSYQEIEPTKELDIDLTPIVDEAREMYQNNSFLKSYVERMRGISPEVVQEYGIGALNHGIRDLQKQYPDLLPKVREPEKYNVLLPFINAEGKTAYFIAERPRNPQQQKAKQTTPKYLNLKDVAMPLFNERYLEQKMDGPIALTEGIYDALSFESAGIKAIALCGTARADYFLKKVEAAKTRPAFLLAMDNDEAGKTAAAKIRNGLKRLGIRYMNFEYGNNEYNDPNEWWNQDPQGFEANLNSLDEAYGAIDTPEEDPTFLIESESNVHIITPEEERQHKLAEYRLTRSPKSLIKNYLERKRGLSDNPIPTGLYYLDRLLGDGLRKGLYSIGAASGLGKTTFCLQLADHMASRGFDVLFITLEMSMEELVDKSISRKTCEISLKKNNDLSTARTFRDLNTKMKLYSLDDREQETLEEAVEKYNEYAERIYFVEREEEFTVEDVEKAIRRHVEATGKIPAAVFVDYLQILTPLNDRLSDKQAVDRNVSRLRILAKRYGIPVIDISSINRASYGKRITYEAFKEAGSIEYSSDYVIGLNYVKLCDEKAPIEEEIEARRELIEQGEPIPIEVELIKNRVGPTGSIFLDFYPQFNCFLDSPDQC